MTPTKQPSRCPSFSFLSSKVTIQVLPRHNLFHASSSPYATCLHANGKFLQDMDCHMAIHQWRGFIDATWHSMNEKFLGVPMVIFRKLVL